ncbi:MAG: HIT domain-containing protein [Acidimicrobiales bacterium]|nr:HIT domain-containing protein [Acidimicrobiales bacterium]
MTQSGASRLRVLWAGWRKSYVSGEVQNEENVQPLPTSSIFENIFTGESDTGSNYVLYEGTFCAAILNKYPYVSGHTLVLPKRAIPDLIHLSNEESAELWEITNKAVKAITEAYQPDGINVGMNIGKAAGASIPEHLHVHCLPRWEGDTTFLTSIAEARMIPETLTSSYQRLKEVWPAS